MKKLPLFALSFALLGGMVSCSKDKDPAPTKTELLTAKSWRLTSRVTVPAGATAPTDSYDLMLNCEKDNFLKFNATDKTLVEDEGPTKCNPDAPQTITGIWNFNSEQTTIILADSGLNPSLNKDITDLTSSTLKVQYTRPGTDTRVIDTYTAF